MGLSISGSLRYEAQLQATKLCFAFPRPQSDCDGRFLIQLEPSGAVRLPFLSSGQEGAKQAPYCSGHHTYPDSSLLAPEGMVSRPHTCDSRHALTPPTSQGFTTSATHPQVSSGSPRVSVNPVEIVKRLLRHRGYSSRVARFLAKSKRHPTIMNYQYKWKKYRQWCKREGHTISNPSSQKFADFLVF